jgi:pimeloyl-ACP methyl ester carboxylesterase
MANSKLAYDDHGEGPAVLLVHGFPLCRRMWRPQIQPLVAAGYRVITPDLRGYGESPPERFPIRMEQYADDLIALLDDLNVERSVIGGFSMGGYILMSLLERFPERIRAALFLMTRAAADDAAGKQRRKLLADEALASGPDKVADAFASVLFAPGTGPESDLVREVRSWMQATPAGSLAAGLLAMRDRKDYIAQLHAFSLPALVVGADRDLAIPLGHSVVLDNGLPNSLLQVVAGAGHLANLEQPAQFNKILLDYLDGLENCPG